MSSTPAGGILHVTRQLGASGMVLGVLALAERCGACGHTTAILARNGPLAKECARRKLAVLRTDADLAGSRLGQWAAWRKMVAQVREFRPQMLHFHGSELDRAAMHVSRSVGVPYVLTFDGFLSGAHRLDFSRRWCHRVIAPSQGLREDLVNLARLPKDRIEVIPSGISLSDYAPREGQCADKEIPVVGTLWQALPSKGLGQLLRAAQLVIEAPFEAHFLIVGEGSEKRRLWALARELGIGRHVAFPGTVFDHRPVLAALSVFVAPMAEEGSPMATLEAMACARPVVATSVGSTYQIVQDGQTGRLVPRGDVRALADAILALLNDPEEAEALGQRARQFVGEHFNGAELAGRVIACYGLPETSAGQATPV